MSEPLPAGRPSDAALWASVEAALRDTVLAHVDDAHARQVVVHLAGLARYAATRGTDPTAARTAELAAALDDLAEVGNPLVAGRWSSARDRGPASVMAVCGEVLAAAVDPALQGADEARARLRPLLLGHLDGDLGSEAPLLTAFRGRLPDRSRG